MTHIGIDIGKNRIHVCPIPPGQEHNHKKWQVRGIDMENGWQKALKDLVGQGDVVALEPTGWQYSLPVLRTLQVVGAVTLTVGHSTSKQVRALHYPSKTDANDARTLAMIARNWSQGTLYEGVSVYDHNMTDLVAELRTLINLYRVTKRESVRIQNRFRAYAHAVDPALAANPDTFKRAIRAGAVWPGEIHDLARRVRRGRVEGYEHGNTRRSLDRMIGDLADLPPLSGTIRQMLIDAVTDQEHYERRAAEIEEQLGAVLLSDPIRRVSQCWLSVPGAGVYRVAVLHAATYCRPQDFSSDEFKAALGVHPNIFSSGDMAKSKNTSKGYRPAKGELHLWVMGLLKQTMRPNPVAGYYDALVARNHPHAIEATRAKLARILSGIARTGTTWRSR